MAHPHATPDVPGNWPLILAEVASCASADETSDLLLAALAPPLSSSSERTPRVPPGHVCSTAWVVSRDGSHALLVRHRFFGWSAPGGHIEPHETTRSGGLRELEEETGLTRFDVSDVLSVPALVHVADLPGERPHRHWNVAWLYRAEMDSPLSPSEGARWWPCDRLPEGPPDLETTLERLLSLVDSPCT